MNCKGCGYHKNKPGATHCSLCGALLGGEGEGLDPRLGANKTIRGGAVEQKSDDRASQDQIVYAGDFAIVYVFVPTQGGLIILKPGEVFTFGRGDACDHKIDAKAVSRRHARVHWAGQDPPTPEIVDLESKNGITVNGVPVQRKVLEDGDELALGPFAATLRVLSANDGLRGQLQVDRLGATMVSTRRLAGEVKLVPPAWLLGQLERCKESGTLSVQRGEDQGFVTLISGVPIAAGWNDEQTGVEAIRQLARLREGRFTFSPRADATPQSISLPLAEILAQDGGGPGRGGPPPGRPGGPPPRGGPPGPARPGGPPPGRRGPPPKPQRPAR